MNMELVIEFKALADKTRVRIISLLFYRALCVCEIVDVLDMTQSRISRHLGILKHAGFIEEERVGKWVIYKITDKHNAVLSYVSQNSKNDPLHLSDMEKMNKTLEKNMCPTK